MKYSFATADNEHEIRQLLAASDLHHADLTTDQLEHFLLGWDGSRLAGVVGLELRGYSALLRSLAVAADYRNRKIATRLILEIEKHARSLKVNALYLLTMTAEDFFKKNGYQRTARDSTPIGIQGTTEFQSLCPASAVCMVKHLK